MSRSSDQTFYVDHYSKSGYGLGHEFRYALTSPSRGNFRTYGFRRTDAGGGTRPRLERGADAARQTCAPT